MTDHNEISGALEAQRAGGTIGPSIPRPPVKVIVGEEVKTAGEGEVIGLFIEERIPRGLSLAETVAEIHRQGGLVYVPHPFDRMHSVPDYEHLLAILDDVDAIEVFNPRVAISEFNEEAGALRGQVPASPRVPARTRMWRRVSARCASACATSTGRSEFLQSLRDAEIVTRPSSLLYVQALKFLQTRATPRSARRREQGAPAEAAEPRAQRRARGPGGRAPLRGTPPAEDRLEVVRAWPRTPAGSPRAASPDAPSRTSSAPSNPSGSMPITDDEIREKYLERAIRELNTLTRDLQSCPHCPRGNLMPVLGSGTRRRTSCS